MPHLGKIFVYEQDIRSLHQYLGKLEKQGFAAFGTDNLYQLLKYSEQVHPDIVIMNLPEEFNADSQTWQKVENSLCQEKCPQIYINTEQKFSHQPSFHYYNFDSAHVTLDQIDQILKNLPRQNYLH